MTANVAAEARAKRVRPKRWYAQLWVHVLAGMVLGIILGKFYPSLGVRMQPLGDGFIKLIRMLIAPIIFLHRGSRNRAHGRPGASGARRSEGDRLL